MKKWILKAVIQKIISLLPASQRINYLFQKYITKGVRLSDQYFSDKLTHAIDHLFYYNKYSGQKDFKALEIGSGWYPVVPIALFLGGAKNITSIDISPLMNTQGIKETIEKYIQWRKEGKLKKLEPYILDTRWQTLKKIAQENLNEKTLLEKINLHLLVEDARKTHFDDNTFDFINSNNTFEHISPKILKDIVKEFQRILKPSGIMSHFIDMSDHFAHLDNSINIYNFLKFSKKQWQRIDNSVQPQNRLRLKDYTALYNNLNIEIIDEHHRPGDIKEVEKTKLHSDYKAYTTKEIAISHSHLVSSK